MNAATPEERDRIIAKQQPKRWSRWQRWRYKLASLVVGAARLIHPSAGYDD